MTRVLNAKLALFFVVSLLVALFLVDGGPKFRYPANAETTARTINYGVNYPNLTANPNWSVITTDTTGSPIATLIFQTDCNLVEYRDVNHNRTVTWASGTVRPIGTSCSLVFQHDGNVVIYHNGYGAIWATGTNRGAYAYTYNLYSDGTNYIDYYLPGYGYKIVWVKP